MVEGGEFEIQVAASSRDIRASRRVAVDGEPTSQRLSMGSSVKEWVEHPVVGQVVSEHLRGPGKAMADDEMYEMTSSMPLKDLLRFWPTGLTREELEKLVEEVAAARS